MPAAPSVIAIGFDAADPALVRNLIDRGELPALAELEREGGMGPVEARADIGSGAVWPTFFTGREPESHEMYSGGFDWRPDSMRIGPLATQGWLEPFWSPAQTNGTAVGVIDVPFAPLVGLERGFEVSEWGAHDEIVGSTRVGPTGLADALADPHPFSSHRLRPIGGEDRVDPAVLVACAMEGAARRVELMDRLIDRTGPDLAIVTFSEVHHLAHDLWHTVEPDHPLYEDLPASKAPDLLDVYRASDEAIGRVLELAGPDTAVVVFSLHGMQPCRGVVDLLQPVLEALGYATPAAGHGGARGGRARSALAFAKQRAPGRLRRAYHRRTPLGLRRAVAAATMIPSLDWSRTRAFSLPTDQHGVVRMNVRGREAEGIVDPADYGELRAELAESIAALRDVDGRPLVRQVVRLGRDDSPPPLVPDLVVNWTDAALANPVRVSGLDVEAAPLGRKLTGQHMDKGFYLQRGLDPALQGEVRASEMGARLLAAAAPR